MAARRVLFLSLMLSWVLLSGCALQPVAQPDNACLRQFQSVDLRIKAAATRDYGAHRPTGFPWLRSTRFLASFAAELRTEAQWADWMERLRIEDMAARSAELSNAGIDRRELSWLGGCGRQLNQALLADVQARERLRIASQVPDDYSLLKRLFGAYPLALPFLQWGVANYQEGVKADYRVPVRDLAGDGQPLLWLPQPGVLGAESLSRLPQDALGIPQLEAAHWRALAERHAPAWWIETAADYDRPGQPQTQGGWPGVDVTQPVVYFQPGYTRWRGQVLVQLAYVIWFDERPHESWVDPYAGRLDSVIWRVTLDADGRSLFYDSIHSCGCYHRVFPAQGLQPHDAFVWGDEPPLFPQANLPDEPLALRLQSGTHFLRRVVALRQVISVEPAHYQLRPYDELRSLPAAQGQTRSLFGVAGLIKGTQRGERWWLWPSGVSSPGAMRQWGRHAIAFVGMRHFDDPYLAQQLFVD